LDALSEGRTPEAEHVAPSAEGLLRGVRLVPLDDQVRAALGNGPELPGAGAVVAVVEPGGPAAAAGLRRGDVILEINREAVRSPNDVAKLLHGADRALVLVQRGAVQQILFLG